MFDGKSTRKGFLKGLAAVGFGAVAGQFLAACGSGTPAAPTAAPTTGGAAATGSKPAATAAPAGSGPIRVVVSGYGFMLKDVNLALFATTYNGTQNRVIIQPELTPAGPWYQKLAAEVNSNQVSYNAILYANSYSNTPQFAGMGILQPIEDLIRSSSIKDADKRFDLMFAPARTNASYKGVLYGYPLGIQYTSDTIRKDYADNAGYTGDISKSYDEITKAATLIRQKYKDKNVVGISLENESGNGTISYMFWSMTQQPFIKKQIKGQEISFLDFKGKDFIRTLQRIKDWVDQDLTVSKTQAMDLDFKAWQGGVAGLNMQESSLGYVTGVPLFGKDNVAPSVPLPIDGGNGGCLTYFVNTLIPAKAPHAQEALDWLLWCNDPANTDFMNNILTYHWYPVFKSVVADIMEKDDNYKWMAVWGPQIDKSIPYPNDNPYYNLNTDLINKHATKFWAGDYKTAEECAAGLDQDVTDSTTRQMA